MIAFRGVATARGPLATGALDGDWGPGVHAILSAVPDGGRTLLALAAGALRARRGTVRVLDGSPTDAPVRKQIAHVGAEVALPDRLRVDEVLALAAALRGEPGGDAATRLAPWGLERLARRPVASLARAEARGVAIAEAFTSSRVRVVLLEEPFGALDADASERVSGAIRAKAKGGGVVLFSTGSLRDACAFGGDVAVVGRSGSLQPLVPGDTLDGAPGARDGATSEAACVRLALVASSPSDAENLAAHLVHEPDVAGIAYRAALPAQTVVLHVEGRDVVALANAVARAATASRVDVLQLHAETHGAGPP